MNYLQIRRNTDRVRAIPLETVLLAVGAKRDRYDSSKWHTAQGSVSVTGMKFMNWSQGAGGGGAIDLSMHLNGLGFKEAVEWLAERFPATGPGTATVVLPSRVDSKLLQVQRYLVRERCLPRGLIDALIESGRLYADLWANAVFVLLGKDNVPVGAELRGTTHRSWRGMARGSRKDLGYFSTLAPDATSIILCESAIDAMSCSVIFPTRLNVSTSGARSNPRWLASLISEGYEVICGFDSDSAGDRAAKLMLDLFPSVKRMRPIRKDWNDVVRLRLR